MTYLFSIFMAILAYSCISTGFVFQKMGIACLGPQKKRDKHFYKNLALWLTGFLIMNLYGIPSAVALKHLPAHIVAAFAGWGIVVLVFLSHFLLKEKLTKQDTTYSLLIITGIVALNLFQKPTTHNHINITGLTALCLLPPLLFTTAFLKTISKKLKTILFAAASGLSAALMVVSLGVLVQLYQYRIGLYLGSPYLYIYIFFALLSLAALQMALKNGEMILIGPLQYSTNIIYPVAAVLLIFNHVVPLTQILAVGLIVYAVIMLLKNR